MSRLRTLVRTLKVQPTSDGVGVKIQRITGFNIKSFSPFLMIDELHSDSGQDYLGGFPAHPHRGIETFSYMIKGHFQHKDSLGHSGELRSGGTQWMASGKGIIHSEMPIMDKGLLHGFQIWINQTAADKATPPQYIDLQAEEITELESSALGKAKVLAGSSVINNVTASSTLNRSGVPINIIDWCANEHQQIQTTLDKSFNAMVFVYQGSVQLDGQLLTQGQLGMLSAGDTLQLTATQKSGVLILAGKPINEPVVHYGPFVMNSMDEINQAIDDYNQGRFEAEL